MPSLENIPVPSIKVFYLLCWCNVRTLVLIIALLTRSSREEGTAWKDAQVAGNGAVAGYSPPLDIKGLINQSCCLVLLGHSKSIKPGFASPPVLQQHNIEQYSEMKFPTTLQKQASR